MGNGIPHLMFFIKDSRAPVMTKDGITSIVPANPRMSGASWKWMPSITVKLGQRTWTVLL